MVIINSNQPMTLSKVQLLKIIILFHCIFLIFMISVFCFSVTTVKLGNKQRKSLIANCQIKGFQMRKYTTIGAIQKETTLVFSLHQIYCLNWLPIELFEKSIPASMQLEIEVINNTNNLSNQLSVETQITQKVIKQILTYYLSYPSQMLASQVEKSGIRPFILSYIIPIQMKLNKCSNQRQTCRYTIHANIIEKQKIYIQKKT